MILFLTLALKDAFGKIPEHPLDSKSLFVLIGLPQYRPGFGQEQIDIIHEVVMDYLQTIHPGPLNLRLMPLGHGAFITGLNHAHEILSDNKADVCVVGSVDSYYEEESLLWLQSRDRLKSPDNRFGFIPGEGAGCVVVANETVAQKKGWPIRSIIQGIGIADEPCPMGADGVCTGQGLSEAMAEALSSLPGNTKIDQIFSDMNGERYRSDEFGFSMLRHGKAFKDPNRLMAPVHQWGDMGAAAGPNLVNLHIESDKSGFGPLSMIVTSSDSGKRCALILESVE